MQAGKIRIGTRGSPLALAQAHEVRSRLMAASELPVEAFEVRVIKTSGDRIQDRPLAEVGGKGLFTKEIEEALLADTIDLAVHSMKDMMTELPPGLVIGAVLEREDPRDAFMSLRAGSLSELPRGARVGTSSLRRQAQVKRLRPDLEVVGFRGNVQTRLKKLEQGLASATLLAVAGLKRLGEAHRITQVMSTEEMLPAVAQGAIAIEVRERDEATRQLVAKLSHEPTSVCILAERSFLARLDGSCRTPIAGLAEIDANGLRLRGMILALDGSTCHETELRGATRDASRLGLTAAEQVLAVAGPNFLRS